MAFQFSAAPSQSIPSVVDITLLADGTSSSVTVNLNQPPFNFTQIASGQPVSAIAPGFINFGIPAWSYALTCTYDADAFTLTLALNLEESSPSTPPNAGTTQTVPVTFFYSAQ